MGRLEYSGMIEMRGRRGNTVKIVNRNTTDDLDEDTNKTRKSGLVSKEIGVNAQGMPSDSSYSDERKEFMNMLALSERQNKLIESSSSINNNNDESFE
jgi:hypothetical protein